MNQDFSTLLDGSADKVVAFIEVLLKVCRWNVLLVNEHILILALKLGYQSGAYCEDVGDARSSQGKFIMAGLIVAKPDVLRDLVLGVDFELCSEIICIHCFKNN